MAATSENGKLYFALATKKILTLKPVWQVRARPSCARFATVLYSLGEQTFYFSRTSSTAPFRQV